MASAIKLNYDRKALANVINYISGLYYKHVMIVTDNASIISKRCSKV
jgi:hypothetical protein